MESFLQPREAKRGGFDFTFVSGQIMSVVYVTTDQPNFNTVIGAPTTTDFNPVPSTDSSSPQSTDQPPSAAPTTSESAPTAAPSTVNLASQATDSATPPPASAAATSQAPTTYASPTYSTPSSSYSYTNTAVQAANTSDASNSSSSSSGMSGAGKAGVAIGIILAIGAILGIALFLLKKKHEDRDEENKDAEKNDFLNARSGSGSKAAPAPRLSLRPASSFLTDIMGGGRPRDRNSQGNMLTPMNGPNSRNRQAPPNFQAPLGAIDEKPGTHENPFKDPENPFADSNRAPNGPPGPMSVPMMNPGPSFDPIPVAAAAAAGTVIAAQSATRNDRPHDPQRRSSQ